MAGIAFKHKPTAAALSAACRHPFATPRDAIEVAYIMLIAFMPDEEINDNATMAALREYYATLPTEI